MTLESKQLVGQLWTLMAKIYLFYLKQKSYMQCIQHQNTHTLETKNIYAKLRKHTKSEITT